MPDNRPALSQSKFDTVRNLASCDGRKLAIAIVGMLEFVA